MNRTENVLDGIQPMGYGSPSAVCYIGSVIRLMEYLRDPVEADELFSLSGAALCFPWKINLTCDEISILPEIPRRTFAALGYKSEYVCEPDIKTTPRKYSKEFYIEKIKASIDAGKPVIGFGFTELNFTCLLTGYFNNGEGLYLRSYWSPGHQPTGYDAEQQYYRIENWYDKFYGIIVIGEKTADRLSGGSAYGYIKENARIFKDKKTETAYGQTIYNNTTAYEDMIMWLLDDSQWLEGCDMNYRDCLLKPCGVLLLNHYRSHLHSYLGRLDKQYPGLVNPEIRPAIERLGECFPGAERSTLSLEQCIDPSVTDFAMLHEHAVRGKVAEYVQKLRKFDSEIFDAVIE